MLRTKALGSFLTADRSIASNPNENLARELMELLTLSPGDSADPIELGAWWQGKDLEIHPLVGRILSSTEFLSARLTRPPSGLECWLAARSGLDLKPTDYWALQGLEPVPYCPQMLVVGRETPVVERRPDRPGDGPAHSLALNPVHGGVQPRMTMKRINPLRAGSRAADLHNQRFSGPQLNRRRFIQQLMAAGSTPHFFGSGQSSLSLTDPDALWFLAESDWEEALIFQEAMRAFEGEGLGSLVGTGHAVLDEVAGQLSSLSDGSIDVFLGWVDDIGRSDDVVVATISEFGRRVEENDSGLDNASLRCRRGRRLQRRLTRRRP